MKDLERGYCNNACNECDFNFTEFPTKRDRFPEGRLLCTNFSCRDDVLDTSGALVFKSSSDYLDCQGCLGRDCFCSSDTVHLCTCDQSKSDENLRFELQKHFPAFFKPTQTHARFQSRRAVFVEAFGVVHDFLVLFWSNPSEVFLPEGGYAGHGSHLL